jgi:AAA ATPase domain
VTGLARSAQMVGRSREISVLDGLVSAVRAGESRVLVVRGEAGVGKTALLEHLAGHAAGCRVVRAAGVQSEMEFAPLDAQVRNQVVAEAAGNPLALLELPRGLTPAELAGGFGLPGSATSLTGRIEDSFRRRLDAVHRRAGWPGTDRPGNAGRAAGSRRAVQPGDRHPAFHQLAHRPVPPEQGLRQARHHLPRPAPPRAARRLANVIQTGVMG